MPCDCICGEKVEMLKLKQKTAHTYNRYLRTTSDLALPTTPEHQCSTTLPKQIKASSQTSASMD